MSELIISVKYKLSRVAITSPASRVHMDFTVSTFQLYLVLLCPFTVIFTNFFCTEIRIIFQCSKKSKFGDSQELHKSEPNYVNGCGRETKTNTKIIFWLRNTKNVCWFSFQWTLHWLRFNQHLIGLFVIASLILA